VLLLLPCLGSTLLGSVLAEPLRASSGASTAPWPPDVLEKAALLPLQEGGRIKPLDAFAGFSLLRLNHKRSCQDADGVRQTHLEWMLDVLFRPERARRAACFLVEDSQVLDAVGFTHDGKNRRDRYTYAELAPIRARLTELARDYMRTESKQRSQVENGVVDLWGDLDLFDALAGSLDFARVDLPVPPAPKVKALFPERTSVNALEVAARLDELSDLAPQDDPHAGMGIGVPGHAHMGGGHGGADLPSHALTDDASAAKALRERAFGVLQAATVLAVLPPAPHAGAQAPWVSLGRVVFEGALGQDPTPDQQELVRGWMALARAPAGSPEFAQALDDVHDRTVNAARARGEYDKVSLEVTLGRLDPFYRAIYLYLLAFLTLALSWARPSRWLVRLAWALIVAGLALHVGGIVVRSVLRERPPVSTLYDTTLFIAMVGVAGCLVAERIQRRGVALALAPVLGALLLFVGQRFEELKGEDTLPQLVAVLDTNFWLALHVTCITIGYGGGLLAAAVAHVHVLGRAVGAKRDDPGFYALLTRMAYGMLAFGLVFSVVGTILGGIWANESWGRFWGWDPKENGALMICLSQLAILHARMGGLLKPFGIAVATILSGCVIAFSWWGVNLLGIGLHSYGFTGGIMRGLTIFYGAEALVLLVALATHLAGRSYGARAGAA
jgi:ABC-type transport system involved in cytochrome c biogenesis permease subunit